MGCACPVPNAAYMKKRRFLQPLRGLRRIFRKKGRASVISATADEHAGVNGLRASNENLDFSEQAIDSNLEPAKSHSTSHLDDDQADNGHRNSLQSTTLLSVSHDSVFTSEQRSPNSGSETSLYVVRTTRLGFPNSSVRAELFEAVRSRRRAQENNVSDDEDLGLPRSPVSNSPRTADDMFTKENIVTKSSQSTCSDGSLLSMGSSEIDEESYCYNSRHSSKVSLYEKRVSVGSDLQHNDRSTNSSNTGDGASLSHSAAKHKMAVKPKRNHGAPHKKRQHITSNILPATPELNEESNPKSAVTSNSSPASAITTPTSCKDASSKSVADTGQSDKHQTNQNHTSKTQPRTEHYTSVTQITSAASKRYADQSGDASKYSSLPPVVSVSPVPSFKLLARSKSNASSTPSTSEDVVDEKESSRKEDGTSFFSRLLLRRSSKKKKNAPEEPDSQLRDDTAHQTCPTSTRSWPTSPDEHMSLPCLKEEPPSMAYVNGALASAMKHHPLFRQRVEPLNLPPPREETEAPCARVSYSSTVPVNMSDSSPPSSLLIDTKSNVHKSHSFRSSDKLPYNVCKDTPSLPVNIGLIEDHVVNSPSTPTVIAVLEEKRYSHVSNCEAVSDDEKLASGVCESITPVMGVTALTGPPRWKPPPPKTAPDYENLAAVSKLSISVNEGVEPSVEVITEAKSVVAQTPPEVKIPVPAPRTSLLNRTSSNSQLGDESSSNKNSSSSDRSRSSSINDSINVTVTESADGQRSIISIGSNLTPSLDVRETSPIEVIEHPLLPTAEDGVSKVDQLEDDVFQPQTDSSPIMVEHSSPPASLVLHEVTETESLTVSNDDNESSVFQLPEEATELMSTKSEEEEGRECELPSKPVIVADLKAGVMKVNDTTVMMRKKTPQPRRDEEPELMKVFARRSLKLKEDPLPDEPYDGTHKSRDSDKENEDSNVVAPPEEQTRKKRNEAPDAVIAAIPPKPAAFGRFQRSVSHDVEKNVLGNSQSNHINDKRQRCKSTSMLANEVEKRAALVVEKSVSPTPPNTPASGDEKPTFKRIQQRREEWEKRAQQAMKVHGTK